MHPLDLAVVVAFLVGLVAVAGWLAGRQRGTRDYYLAGGTLPAWALGVSLAANQVSAISLVGAPAFVALREGGGLRWLQYELAVPLAMAALVVWGVPILRRAPGADVYGAVEARLGAGARRTVAAFFLLGRGLGAGVVVYTSALVVAAVTGWSTGLSLAVVAAVAVVYTALGGLLADVVSDVVQFVLLWGGTVVAGLFVAGELRDRGRGLLQGIDPDRLRPLDLAGHGLGDGATFAFLPMLVGGLFLYLSYYGCDQTQAQRILAAPDEGTARRALTWGALLRFPLVATYCLFGLLLAAFLSVEPAFAAALDGRPPDALVPEFLVTYLPPGVLGVAMAGILAAALSSIDSALNSLSAVTLEEFGGAGARASGGTLGARLLTLAWGAWAGLTGWWFSGQGETVIELVNQVGSLVYGPMLALFLLAWKGRRVTGRSAVAGALAGVAANLLTAWWAPGVSWLWWNVLGCGVGLATAELGGSGGAGAAQARGGSSDHRPSTDPRTGAGPGAKDTDARRLATVLVLEFGCILMALALLTASAG